MIQYKHVCFYLLLALGSVFTTSCTKDFNPNAEYKDVTIVYGLINADDSLSSLKIVKAFTVDENVYILAKDSSENIYGDYLSVDMLEYTGTWDDLKQAYTNKKETGKVLHFSREYIYNKEDGTFYNPVQVVYRCATKGNLKTRVGSTAYLYGLRIINNNTGETVQTDQPVALVEPLKSKGLFPIDGFNLNFTNDPKSKITFSWLTVRNGRRYEPVLRFFYNETISGITHLDSLDYKLSTILSDKLNGDEAKNIDVLGSAFLRVVQNQLAAKPMADRVALGVQFIITVGAEDINNYIELSKPSTTIVQDRPEYTNMINGFGIFSSKMDNSLKSYLSYRMYDIDLEMYKALQELNVGF